jgi:hypothetical protein
LTTPTLRATARTSAGSNVPERITKVRAVCKGAAVHVADSMARTARRPRPNRGVAPVDWLRRGHAARLASGVHNRRVRRGESQVARLADVRFHPSLPGRPHGVRRPRAVDRGRRDLDSRRPRSPPTRVVVLDSPLRVSRRRTRLCTPARGGFRLQHRSRRTRLLVCVVRRCRRGDSAVACRAAAGLQRSAPPPCARCPARGTGRRVDLPLWSAPR